ncbi:hypothetical protein Tco_0669683 [Tanacetum coccineum]
MATTSEADSKHEAKGKMILTELNITSVAYLSSTDSNKIIEGAPIQANMDAEDTDYFDQLLQLGGTYRISGFSCQKTPTTSKREKRRADRAISGIETFGNATTQRKLRRTIDVENLRSYSLERNDDRVRYEYL